MHEFKCEYCGTVKIVKYKSEIGRYCSHTCANKDTRSKHIDVDLSYDWKSYKKGCHTMYVCRYNENVSCNDRNCGKCGWNPEVEAARSKAIFEKGLVMA